MKASEPTEKKYDCLDFLLFVCLSDSEYASLYVIIKATNYESIRTYSYL